MARLVLACTLARSWSEGRRLSDLEGEKSKNLEELVEVLAGTESKSEFESNGNVLPSVKRPWGFNDWSPQTDRAGGGLNKGWWFVRSQTSFQGMRCTHQPSPWIGDYAGAVVIPHLAEQPGSTHYSSQDATFLPHLFSTSLTEGSENIGFEFTPTNHAALFRVDFGNSPTGHITVQSLEGTVEAKEGYVTGNSMMTNHFTPGTWKGMFFVVKPISAATGCTSQGGSSDPGVRCDFSGSEPVLLAMATSFISEEQALRNLELELMKNGKMRDFDEVVVEGRDDWRARLNTVQVTAQDDTQRRVFYTNLWRAHLFPRSFTEVDENGNDVHMSPYTGQVVPGKLVTDSGFWDAYRTVYNLHSLISRDALGDMIDGWVNSYTEQGWLPQWASPDSHTAMMSGTMGDVPLADAIVKSQWGLLKGFDVEKAYEAIRKDAFEQPEERPMTNPEKGSHVAKFGRAGLSEYEQNGFLSTGTASESVTLSLGYYEADAAIANAARALNQTDDAAKLEQRSKQYTKLFNTESKFFQPKGHDSVFLSQFDPIAWNAGFTEGNAWHYRFGVPHDVEGLNELYGGNLCGAISEMVTYSDKELFHGPKKIEMLQGQRVQEKKLGMYAHSNQPVHQVLYIAKAAGCNELADEALRRTMSELYTTDGWSGDEDNGEMGAWYVLSALGLFQLEGGKDELILGSPAVKAAAVNLGAEKVLRIQTEGQSAENVFVRSVTWTPTGGNAMAVTDNKIKYTEVMKGGTLKFTLSSTPSSASSAVSPHGSNYIL